MDVLPAGSRVALGQLIQACKGVRSRHRRVAAVAGQLLELTSDTLYVPVEHVDALGVLVEVAETKHGGLVREREDVGFEHALVERDVSLGR